MGLLTRAVVPRSVRRATHPVRTAKSAVTPRSVKQVRRVLNPIDSTVYSAERALNTKSRKKGRTARTEAESFAPLTPEGDRRTTRLVLGALLAVIAVIVVLGFVIGWAATLSTTVVFTIFGFWVAGQFGR